MRSGVSVTYIGGPTALVECGGLRLLTDPTFDPAGTGYPTQAYTLHKTQPPAIDASALGRVTRCSSATITTSTTSIAQGARCWQTFL
jgi:hypothetical protein